MRRDEERTQELLAALSDPQQRRIDGSDVAVVVAHADDETIGCGAQLARLVGVTVVTVTDGAPRSMHDARARGLASAGEYAAVRAAEWRRALDVAGIGRRQRVALGIPDQEAAHQLERLTWIVASILVRRRVSVALTHAYEGGHPDHDAVACAVHRAALYLRARGVHVGIIEMPFYREEGGRLVTQAFEARDGAAIVTAQLSVEQVALKAAMREAYRSQAETLALFTLEHEQFRRAPVYDFSLPPNGGRVLYEHYDWGMDLARWRDLVSGLPPLTDDAGRLSC